MNNNGTIIIVNSSDGMKLFIFINARHLLKLVQKTALNKYTPIIDTLFNIFANMNDDIPAIVNIDTHTYSIPPENPLICENILLADVVRSMFVVVDVCNMFKADMKLKHNVNIIIAKQKYTHNLKNDDNSIFLYPPSVHPF